MSIRFEWDERKSRLNQEKHGVSFEEASSAFYDENGLVIADPDHSEIEERFILLGMILRLRVLTVCHCFRSDDQTVRIISARKATRRESLQYRNSL